MSLFFTILKRRLINRTNLLIVAVSVLIMLISHAVLASPEIEAYFQIKSGEHFFTRNLPGVLSEAAASRDRQDSIDVISSQAFSFYTYMHYALSLFHLLANVLIVLPCLAFFDERKSGFSRLMALRTGVNKYFTCEAVATSLSGWLITLIPGLVLWGGALAFAPSRFPLMQKFQSTPEDFFQLRSFENDAIYMFLLMLIVSSLGYFFKALLSFIVSFAVDRKVILIFFPLLYSYGAYALFDFVGLNGYADLSYFNESMRSISPLLVSLFTTIVVSIAVMLRYCRKEKVLNG